MCVGRNCFLFLPRCERFFLLSNANLTEINETPLILIFFFFERSSHDTWRFYGYVERKASQTQRDDFAAIFANRHVRFIPAEGDAEVFRGGLSCAWRTDTARTALWLSLSLSLPFPIYLSLSLAPSFSLSQQNIESRYLRFPAVSRPRRSRVRNVRHGHATCVRVITRSQPLPSFAFTRTYIRHTCIADAVLRHLSSRGTNSFVL